MQIRRLAVSAAIVAALAMPESREERAIRYLLSFFRWMNDQTLA